MKTSKFRRFGVAGLLLASLTATGAAGAASQAHAATPPPYAVTPGHVFYFGHSTLAPISASNPATLARGTGGPEFSPVLSTHDADAGLTPHSGSTPATEPSPGGTANYMHPAQTTGFDGLDVYQERYQSQDGNNEFGYEPPDQGLAEHGGYVLEAVNAAVAAYDTHGNRLSVIDSLSDIFNQIPQINRTTGVYGPEIGDPSILFDPSINRWIVSSYDFDFRNSQPTGHAYSIFAISDQVSPIGSYTVFGVETSDVTSNTGPANPNCPCFGDFPQIGVDTNGFYISVNSFGSPFFTNENFNGAEIYAISKQQLLAQATIQGSGASSSEGGCAANQSTGCLPVRASVNEFQYTQIQDPDAAEGNTAFTLQPSQSPNALFDRSNGGTEYFMETTAFNFTDNRLGVFAMSNTYLLAHNVAPILTGKLVTGESYTFPTWGINQKRTCQPGMTAFECSNTNQTLNMGDFRMQHIWYAFGHIWGAANTQVTQTDSLGTPLTESAWWDVATTNGTSTAFNPSIAHQGYVSAASSGLSAWYPAIAVNNNGQAVMGVTISGPNIYPSTGYAVLNPSTNQFGPVHITGVGQGPDDGFSYLSQGFECQQGNCGRWGDYSEASVDPTTGNIWVASEYISGDYRYVSADWGTFVTQVNPSVVG